MNYLTSDVAHINTCIHKILFCYKVHLFIYKYGYNFRHFPNVMTFPFFYYKQLFILFWQYLFHIFVEREANVILKSQQYIYLHNNIHMVSILFPLKKNIYISYFQ